VKGRFEKPDDLIDRSKFCRKGEQTVPKFRIPKAGRIAAGILCAMTLAVLLFSAFYIAAEADHHCEGHDCPVCACIHQCENLLHHFGMISAAVLCIVTFSLLTLKLTALHLADFTEITPVTEKVRLNN